MSRFGKSLRQPHFRLMGLMSASGLLTAALLLAGCDGAVEVGHRAAPSGVPSDLLTTVSVDEPASQSVTECEQEIAEYQSAWEAYVDAVENPPTIAMRIFNETDETAIVTIASRVPLPAEPRYPSCAQFHYGLDLAGQLQLVRVGALNQRTEVVRVLPRGTVVGHVPCGDVLGLAVAAGAESFGHIGSEGGFGLYVADGNVDIGGLGVSGEGRFDGDVVSTARYLLPIEDGLECEGQTLVLQITSPATSARFNHLTGEYLGDGEPGEAELSLESTR